jgi:hypothetical protein
MTMGSRFLVITGQLVVLQAVRVSGDKVTPQCSQAHPSAGVTCGQCDAAHLL